MTQASSARRCTVLALAALCCTCSSGGGGKKKPVKIHGSGHLVDELRPVSDFVRVTHASEGDLYVEQAAPAAGGLDRPYLLVVTSGDGSRQVERGYLPGDEAAGETLLVRAEDNLQPYLRATVEGGVLKLRTAPDVDLVPTLPIEFFLTVTSLEALSFQGVGSVEVLGLETGELALSCTGVGDVVLTGLDAVELQAEVGGLNDVRVSGAVERQTVKIGTFGIYRAEELRCGEADVVTAAWSDAFVRVCDLLTVTIKSKGSLYYWGSPTVDATIEGSGKVEQVDEDCEPHPLR